MRITPEQLKPSPERTREIIGIWEETFGYTFSDFEGNRISNEERIELFRQTIVPLSDTTIERYNRHGFTRVLIDRVDSGTKSTTMIDLSRMRGLTPPVLAGFSKLHSDNLVILISNGKYKHHLAKTLEFEQGKTPEILLLELHFKINGDRQAPYRPSLDVIYRP